VDAGAEFEVIRGAGDSEGVPLVRGHMWTVQIQVLALLELEVLLNICINRPK